MTKKYRDTGQQPTRGRSGSASIQARALLAKDGGTNLEITTGSLEEGAPAPGNLEKVQVKFLSPGGDVLQTTNHQKSLAGGSARFHYDNLTRGQLIQMQANVSGIDRNRTDVVTVNTSVALSPDIQAVSINAPSEAMVDAQVVVMGVMGEVNGDVGARATCRLLADGVEIGSTADAWVDAASFVTCQFQTSFSAVGTKQLTFVVSGLSPADYDEENNGVTRSIEIIDPAPVQTFSYMQASAWENTVQQENWSERTFRFDDGRPGGTYTGKQSASGRFQSHGVFARFPGLAPRTSGTITLIESGDGELGSTTTVNIADFPYGTEYSYNSGCRSALTSEGLHVGICSDPRGITEISAFYNAGEVTYFDSVVSTGEFWGYNESTTQTSQTHGGGLPAFRNLGTVYTATLMHEAEGFSNTGTMSAVLRPITFTTRDLTGTCWLTIWPHTGEERGCYTYWHYRNDAYGGEAFRFQ